MNVAKDGRKIEIRCEVVKGKYLLIAIDNFSQSVLDYRVFDKVPTDAEINAFSENPRYECAPKKSIFTKSFLERFFHRVEEDIRQRQFKG